MSFDIILNSDVANNRRSPPSSGADMDAIMSLRHVLNKDVEKPRQIESPTHIERPAHAEKPPHAERTPLVERPPPNDNREHILLAPMLHQPVLYQPIFYQTTPPTPPTPTKASHRRHHKKINIPAGAGSFMTLPQNPPKRRGAFPEAQRAETARVRRMKACVRCRCQRIRCVSDENDPEGWCVPCKGVWPTLSKKVIHRLPCVRYKCTEIVLYRPYVRGGSLNAIRRREEPSMTGLDTQEWASKEIKTIDITLGICEEPVALKVCKFTPQDGKVLVRTWLEGSVDKDMPPYALADMRSTACWFREYVTRNCLQPTTLGLALQNSDPLIQETYKAAIQHYYRLQSFQVTVNSPRAIFLHNLFKLWFANRHMVGSSWICGKEILEIDPGSEVEQHPLSKRVRTPRLVVAQFDNVNILEILTPLRVDVLHQLEDMLGRNNIQDWFTVYVAVFILLHEVSVSSKDRAEDAIANSAESRYSLPHFVEELQMGANIILVHWHYYRRQANPLTITDQLDSPLSELTPEEFDFVVKSYKFMEKRWTEMKILLEQKNWEHEYYWVSQMFDTNMWAPKPGFATINKEDTTDERCDAGDRSSQSKSPT